MVSSKVYFTGFNAFGQFKNLPNIVTSFTEIKLESLAPLGVQIKMFWDYCVYVNECNLYICGCINGDMFSERRFPFEYSIKDIACTDHFCLVLLSIGTVYKIHLKTFEINEINSTIIERSLLGDRDNTRMIFNTCSAQHENELNHMKDEFVTHVAAGRSLAVLITNKNNVYNLPLKIYTFSVHVKIKKVCCGNEHCLILTTNGDLYAFGSSLRGQLGTGELESKEEPVLIEALAGIKIIDVAAGGWHSAAVSAFNDLYVWGWNVNGQIGLPLYTTYETMPKEKGETVARQKCSTVFATPTVIDLPKSDSNEHDDEDFVSESQYHPVAVSAGARHTVVQIDDGSLMAAGWNKYGQLGNESLNEESDRFHIISKHASTENQVICGDWSTFVISSECNVG